ncbi:hypothetical protein ABZ639_12500 [Saccharomonospora sp. NPDC006951]
MEVPVKGYRIPRVIRQGEEMRRSFSGTLAFVAAVMMSAAVSASADQQVIIVDNPNVNGHFAAGAEEFETINESSGTVTRCPSAVGDTGSLMSGVLLSGEYVIPSVGELSGWAFYGCHSIHGSLDMSLVDSVAGITVVDVDSVAGVTSAYLGPLSFEVVSPGCDYSFSGHVPVGYSNSGEFQFGSNSTLPAGVEPLQVNDDVVGCFGLYNPGDRIQFTGTFTVTDPSPPLTITTP